MGNEIFPKMMVWSYDIGYTQLHATNAKKYKHNKKLDFIIVTKNVYTFYKSPFYSKLLFLHKKTADCSAVFLNDA